MMTVLRWSLRGGGVYCSKGMLTDILLRFLLFAI